MFIMRSPKIFFIGDQVAEDKQAPAEQVDSCSSLYKSHVDSDEIQHGVL